MKVTEIKSVAKAVAPAIREYADAAQKPLVDRMDSVVSRLDALAARLDAIAVSEPAPEPSDRRRKAASGFDGRAFGEEVVDAVKSYVAKSMDAATARLDAIEKRAEAAGATLTAAEIEAEVARQVAAALAARADPTDGESVTIDDVRQLVEDEVAAAVARVRRQESVAWRWPTQRADGWPHNLPVIDVDPTPSRGLEHSVAEAVALLPRPAN